LQLFGMPTAVKLYDQTLRLTAEIRNELPNRELPAKFGAVNLAIADAGRELRLRIGLIASQLARALMGQLFRMDRGGHINALTRRS
jgi:hypothetical protein